MTSASSSSLSIAVMFAAGAMIALQGPINATLGRAIGSPVNAALVSFLVGTVLLALIALTQRVAPDGGALRALPWWAWVGGVCGTIFVTGAAFAVPRIGVASMLTIGIASQLLMAVLLDHLGALNVPQRSVTFTRLVGVALVMLGTVIVRRA